MKKLSTKSTLSTMALSSTMFFGTMLALQGTPAHAATVTVKDGDTVSELALAQNDTVANVISKNHLSSNGLIIAGQQLNVGNDDSNPAQPVAAKTYKVVAGDSIWGIAKKFNIGQNTFEKINSLTDDSLILPGDELKLTATDTVKSTQTTTPQAPTIVNTSTLTTNATGTRAAVVQAAQQMVNNGVPYVWGGGHSTAELQSPTGLDCSGLVAYAFLKGANMNVLGTAADQAAMTKSISITDAQPGDLLFWGGYNTAYHVAVYIGNNQYIAAPQPGQNVQVQTINSAFMPSFAGSIL
ncbi:C40 family peptidase [Latilactobacillus sakei]|uniref:C40 family peptidase n=1 Tax=Latilactobacillus sakei TaxID=1599 RepID=UPI00202FC4EA|nr:C40 family peptidase [Latilactobacillus sakei]MCM1636537.1 NlpC/P60 family protein [Latilactobacillus sakei]